LTAHWETNEPERVIVDFHTHIFPPDVRDNRENYVRRDPTFAEIYADPGATIATADDLLTNMDESGVDVSVALGFAWQNHDDIVRHNDYLLNSATSSGGRIIPFITVNMADDRATAEIERCVTVGARGVGELRPDNQGWPLNGPKGRALAEFARHHRLILLFHVTEPGERTYPGRRGCTADAFVAFAAKHQNTSIVGAHLGGDCYRTHICPPDLYVDTAAQPYLYRGDAARPALNAPLSDRLLFGSDFPLVGQARQISEIKSAITGDNALRQALGGNAASLLGLKPDA
jgi:predicted TIM-barrel fold metal-dependent hydrolase